MNSTNIGSIRVSEIALGAMLFGSKIDETLSARMLDEFVGAGGNFIDTANSYAFWIEGAYAGTSEEMLGRWMKARGERDRIVIASKVGACPEEPGAGLAAIEGLTAKAIAEQVEKSLQRLQTDYLDVYYAHIDDRTTPLEETLAAFDRLVRDGKVRAIGCSNHTAWRIEQARQISSRNGFAEYEVLQQQYSYLRPEPTSEPRIHPQMSARGGHGVEGGLLHEHIDYIREHPDFRVVAYTPMLRGAYADQSRLEPNFRTQANEARLKVLREVAADMNATLGQISLAWMMQSKPAIIPLIAASSLGQLAENLSATAIRLSGEQMAALNGAAQ